MTYDSRICPIRQINAEYVTLCVDESEVSVSDFPDYCPSPGSLSTGECDVLAWKTFDAAQAIAQHIDISSEQIELALRIIGFRSHTPGLQKLLRRAEELAGRFEALRAPCPGLGQIIDCFILAGRLAKFASAELGSNDNRAWSINSSQDQVFSLNDQELGELEKDIFAVCWIVKSIALIHTVQGSISLSTSSLLYRLQICIMEEDSKQELAESLRPYPFWERIQRLCNILSEEDHVDNHFSLLHEALADLSTLQFSGLQSPKIELRDAIQLPLTERTLTAAHWHFPRPAELESLRTLVTESNLMPASPIQTETLIILIALATGRDICQALTILISGPDLPDNFGDQQRLALRKRRGYYGRPIYAEWHIPIGSPHHLILSLPERLCKPMKMLVPERHEGRLIDFLPPTSTPWDIRCNNLLADLFGCTPRQANLKLRDCLIRQSYEISGNRGFIQWLRAGRPHENQEPPRSEQISLSAYLNPKGFAAEETYKNSLRKLLGKFGKTQDLERSIGNFGVNIVIHQEAAKFLRRQIDTAAESNDLLAQHNTFTMYSLCLLIIATGHRKSNTPFYFAFDLHLEHQLAFIADKCIVGSEARFVPLTTTAIGQIHAYIEHLRTLAIRLKGINSAVVRHISSLLHSVPYDCKSRSITTPLSQEFGLFFQILPDGSIETIRTGQLDALFKNAEFKSRIGLSPDAKPPSRIGLFRKTIADYLWDTTQSGHLVAALLGHANDHHPFGPASVWTIADWSNEIGPLIETYLTERKWEIQESPLCKLKLANKISMLSVAGLQPTCHSYEGRIKERESAKARARRAIKEALTDEFLEDNDYHVTNELFDTIREQIDQLLNNDGPARNAASAELANILKMMTRRGGAVDSTLLYIPHRADSPVKISFSRYLSNAAEFRKCWIQLVGSPIGGAFDTVERLAQLAICLVVFDGVLDTKRIKASIDSVIGGTGISDHVDTLSIRACVETRDHQFDALTIPGDLSTAFILGLEAELQKLDPAYLPSIEQVLDRMEDILKKIYGRTAKVSLKLLCDIFKPWWLIRLPGAIYSIAIGQHNGPCPNQPSEISLFASQEPEPMPLVSSIGSFSSRSTAIEDARSAARKEIKQLLTSAEGCLEKGTAHNRLQRRRLAKQLEAAMTSKAASWSQAQPIVAYLISFTRALIQDGGKKENTLTFSTIKTYLSWIGPDLIEASWDQDIAELNYQEVNAIYNTVEEACRNKQTSWRLVLELFHRHVRETVGAVDIPWLHQSGNNWKKRCRSSLFTSQAIDHAITTLSNSSSDSGELASASLTMLATGLGYGTRRSESAGLKATDFDVCDKRNLAIRANVIRDLKSFAGRRVISAPLIESKKLRESIAQAAERSTSTPNRKPYLLASYQKDQEIQTIQPIIKAVVESLRSASANKYAVYHDLRRTYATKMIMAGIPLKSGHRGLVRARDRLLGSHPPTQGDIHGITRSTPNDPYLFNAVGRVLGHADESTLLNVYFLGSPIILADRAIEANSSVMIDDGRLGNILGKDRTAIVKMKQRLKAEFPVVDHGTLIRHYIPKFFAQSSQPTPPKIEPLVKPSREPLLAVGSPWAWFDKVLCDRKRRSLSLMEMKQTALKFGIPDEEATSFLDNYEQMLLDTGFTDFEPDNSNLLDGPPLRGEGVLRSAKERQAAIRHISRIASNDEEFRKLLAWQTSSWQRYVAHRDPWLVCRRLEEFEATLSFLCRIGVREGQLRCEMVNTLAAPILQAVSKRLSSVIVHAERRFSHGPSNTRANEIGINIGQLASSAIPDGRDFHRMMALIACLPAFKSAK